MRVVADLAHPAAKVTLLAWNGKYLLKLERGPYEQTYKIDELDVSGDEDVKKLLEDDVFMNEVVERFDQMHLSLRAARERGGV
ncbi:MAG: hypothetical protein LPK19_10095 [Hymenobacteraceae bacterium]|nr:hypothetical protein [Hymenobacteraceae bacterium]MDX5396577.1 hypothetical protein [Hymenobacteraceae bacterium]MDX5512640.1 hypothetical protein [Hymenobacteraceae bacterium]